MIALDTGGIFAALTPRAQEHAQVVAVLLGADPPFLLSPFVLAELDCLVQHRLGKEAQLQLLEEVRRGAYRLEAFTRHNVDEAHRILDSYRDHDMSLADASIVVLANRHDTDSVLTLDEQHLRVLKTAAGRPLRLLPADAHAPGTQLPE